MSYHAVKRSGPDPLSVPPVLLSGDAHPALARAIARELGLDVAEADVDTFADGESR
jgi:phosphoribosylpyrophosphate synthetase